MSVIYGALNQPVLRNSIPTYGAFSIVQMRELPLAAAFRYLHHDGEPPSGAPHSADGSLMAGSDGKEHHQMGRPGRILDAVSPRSEDGKGRDSFISNTGSQGRVLSRRTLDRQSQCL